MGKNEEKRERSRCLECGKVIVYGRKDKKFCNENCKNKYHNTLTGKSKNYRLKINNRLEKNYKILNGLVSKEIKSADLGDLIQWGFSPEYCTGYRKKGCHEEYRCYDIKYYKSATRIFEITLVT